MTATLYLPFMQGGSGPPPPTDGTLIDGGTVTGPDGVTLGAVPGLLSSALGMQIQSAAPPAPALPGGATPIGNFYNLSANRDVFVFTNTTTLILGLPVPANDAARRLLLTSLPYVGVDTLTAVLITHPGLHSPPNNPAAAASGFAGQGTAAATFTAICIFADETSHDFCEVDKGSIEDELKAIFGVMISMGYPPPLLYTQADAYNIENPSVSQSNTYVVTINPAGSSCGSALGYYRWRMQQLNFCFLPLITLSDLQRWITRHEYFHATQAAFPATWADFTTRSYEPWIIEGTASVAEQSDRLGLKRTTWRSLRAVDRPLQSTEVIDEYLTQDFWVFLGQASGSGLDRVITLFEKGATTEDVINWIGSRDGLKNWYWRWVKNQVMVEENITFDGELGQPCTLQQLAVATVRPFDLSNDGYHTGTLPPLTSHVIEVVLAQQYDGLPQLMFWINDDLFGQMPDPDLRYKIYVEGETCTSVPDGFRTVYNISTAKTYYIVVSNTNSDSERSYTVWVD